MRLHSRIIEPDTSARARHRARALESAGRAYHAYGSFFLVRYLPNGDRALGAQSIDGHADVLAATIIADAERGVSTHVFRSRASYESTGPIVAYGRPERVHWIGADAARAELAAHLDNLIGVTR